jgi:hypothetical protein
MLASTQMNEQISNMLIWPDSEIRIGQRMWFRSMCIDNSSSINNRTGSSKPSGRGNTIRRCLWSPSSLFLAVVSSPPGILMGYRLALTVEGGWLVMVVFYRS